MICDLVTLLLPLALFYLGVRLTVDGFLAAIDHEATTINAVAGGVTTGLGAWLALTILGVL